MKKPRLRFNVLPFAAVLLLIAGLGLAGVAVHRALPLKARISRRAEDLRTVRALAERLSAGAEARTKALEAAGTPEDFKTIFLKVFPEGNWASSVSSRDEASGEWDLLRVSVTITDAPLQQVGALVTAAGLRSPPWRLREARLQAGTTAGQGSGALTFEAPERRGGKGRTP